MNKILWYADTRAYLYFGKAITGSKYVKKQFGPVPREIAGVLSELSDEGAIVARDGQLYFYPQRQFISVIDPDISTFTAKEISLVDKLIEIICESHTAQSISDLTHDDIWEMAEIGEEIPYCTIYAAKRGDVCEDDMSWALNAARKLGIAN